MRWDCNKFLRIVDFGISEEGNGWYTFSGRVETTDPGGDPLDAVFRLICAATGFASGPITQVIGCHTSTNIEGKFEWTQQFKKEDGDLTVEGMVYVYVFDPDSKCAISGKAEQYLKGHVADPDRTPKRKKE